VLEAAIVSPVMFLILFGIFEFSLAFRAYLTIDNVVVNGGRGVTIASTNPLADFRALQSIPRSGAAVDLRAIQRVIVYHAAGPTSTITDSALAGCRTGTSTAGSGTPDYDNACNVYAYADIADNDPNTFDCTAGAPHAGTSPSRYWCPTVRDATSAGADYVGFYVEYRYRFVTGMFGSTRTMTAEVVNRIEPQAL
jgi:Flp pilus assembly protein TadG